MSSSTEVRLILEGMAGRVYFIETSPGVTDAVWTVVGEATYLGGNLYQWTSTIVTPPLGFFRAVEQ
jgi:hypothetical protein